MFIKSPGATLAPARLCVLTACFCASVAALADDAATTTAAAPNTNESVSEMVVSDIIYRNRTDTAPPTLEYGLDYFQRFEPLTVGDMLKRVPSVAFLSDVLEYDAVRLRGLPPGYTQILINGKKVPGSDIDRSFFVDRIPAELVDRVEIVRSPSADRSAEGISGALNIVLKDGYSFEGSYMRAGSLWFHDDEVRGTGGAVFGGKLGSSRVTFGADVQGRYNPKSKVTNFYDADGVFAEEQELESDVRDGTDYSFNASLAGPLGRFNYELNGFFVRTDRDEREDVQALEGDPLEVDGLEGQDEDIHQQNWTLESLLSLDAGGGKTELQLGFARFRDDIESISYESDPGDPLEPVERETNDTTDSETSLTLSHSRELGGGTFKFGIDGLRKKRDAAVRTFEIDGTDEEEETPANGIFLIEEQRIDPFVKFSGQRGERLVYEFGVRAETTDIDVRGDDGTSSQDYSFISPSAHIRWTLTPEDRMHFSLARLMRRPDFDLIAPYLMEEEPADEDALRGNPALKPEKSWGLDVGYERRIGARGVVGLNVFYRDIDDVVELVSTGEAADGGGLIYTPDNVNDGRMWGVELDLSAPLAVFNLPDTGVFFNASWLDSKIDDSILGGTRRFQDQPEYVLNGGFIHNLRALGAAFGTTYRHQGKANHVVLGELRETKYDGDLEAFIEKRIGSGKWIVRLAASNLLDGKKGERIVSFDGDSATAIGNAMRAGDIDEIEVESERSGRVIQLVLRAAF